MADKQTFLTYLKDNPDESLSKAEIMEEYHVSAATAYNWMSSPFVMQVLPMTQTKRVTYNWVYHERRATRMTEESPKVAAINKSVNSQYREAANSLRAETKATAPAIDLSLYIPKAEFTLPKIRSTVESALENPTEGMPIRGMIAAMVSGQAPMDQIKNTALLLWEIADYLEKNPNEFKE